MEFWTQTIATPTLSADFARRAEAVGWDGMLVVDSQNLWGDPYVCLALAGAATERLGLATSVTNPVTRYPAATASSALSLQSSSGGRMVLGVGRGDSALAHLGRAPARLGWFERYLAQLQDYLRGVPVPFEELEIPERAAPPASTLGLAGEPESSAIRWLDDGPKVPVEVAATGRRVIGIAARHADRVLFALGAEPKRVAWGIDTARRAAEAAGRDPDTLRYGAFVNLVCHDDPVTARNLNRPGTSVFARFSGMYDEIAGPADAGQAAVFRDLHDHYDMNYHARPDGPQTRVLTEEFIDGYGIVGGPEHCVARLGELGELGVEKFAVIGPNFSAPLPEAREAAARFTEEVIPRLRG
ncbi:MAG: LLM class flavin-dependent oxidoreductase [Gammaproteobacteria bacterium]|nr:LLM class flavin-dependent oxidoreductase [Gammaproteobacteria bacterium]